MRLGIIGFGAFGRLAAKHLSKRMEVVVSSRSDRSKEAKAADVRQVSIEDACKSDIVLLCVPISQIQDVIRQIGPLVHPGTLVMDACSVKVLPCRLMETMVPKDVEVIGTHPLFGPQSASNGIAGLKVAICPIRTTRTKWLKDAIKSMGMEALEMTPKEHDEDMARTQALVHFIAKAVAKMPKPTHDLGLKSYDALMQSSEMVSHDSQELFIGIETKNPFSKEIRKKFVAELVRIEAGLEMEAEAE